MFVFTELRMSLVYQTESFPLLITPNKHERAVQMDFMVCSGELDMDTA